MTTKKRGLPASALEVKEIKAPAPGALATKKEEDITLSLESQMQALQLHRRKVNNYRQSDGIARLIEECEEEALAIPGKKMNKVEINKYAMLAFSELDDEAMSSHMAPAVTIEGLYHSVLSRFKVSKEDIDLYIESINETHQTTVEVNLFINNKFEEAIIRANALPCTVDPCNFLRATGKYNKNTPFYNGTDMRVHALFYYGGLPLDEKIRVVAEIDRKYGPMLSKLTEKQYKERAAKIQEKYGVA